MVPLRVVFVCSGNTCRSPLAAALAERFLRGAGLGVGVESAGLCALAGQPAAAPGQEVARGLNLDLTAHRSRPVEDLPARRGDLWLTMTPAQATELRRRLGEGVAVSPLLPYARALGVSLPGEDALADPLGQGLEAYAELARGLGQALRGVVAAWAAEADRSAPTGPQTKTVALPRLTGLQPTLESTALKLLEEAGELAEGIGKFRALSGERRAQPPQDVMRAIGLELLDVAQTAVTMMFVLEEQYGVNLPGLLHEHVGKLAAKGYLAASSQEAEPSA